MIALPMFLKRIFHPNDGTTFARSQCLWTAHFPSYLELGTHYVVIVKRDHGVSVPVGDPVYEYLIQEQGLAGPVFFINSPHKLPESFFVRRITTRRDQYEILPSGHEEKLYQFRELTA
jgi:hypothetical protein